MNRLIEIRARVNASIPGYQDPMAILDMRELLNTIDTLYKQVAHLKNLIKDEVGTDYLIESVPETP